MRNWIDLFERALDRELTRGVDLSSFDAFMDSLKRIPRDQLVALNDLLKQQRQDLEDQYSGWTTLYHGTDEKIASRIADTGFELTQGRRTVGGMGATIMVDNHGIFLADDPNLAHYFGRNRSDFQYRVIPVQADTQRVLDSNLATPALKRLGLGLLSDYNGSRKTRLAIRDWWWLVDQKVFIDAIKADGHTGVRFREEQSVRRNADALDGHTYCIFDPKSIRVVQKSGVSLKDFYEWLVNN